jgi:hypothetical protein
VADDLEFEPKEDSLIIFDGKFLYLFANNWESQLIPARGVTDIKVMKGMGRSILVENRLGSSTGLSYDKEKEAEVEAFVERLKGALGL